MGFYNKVKWILGILMIFVLIVATNLIDRNNFLRVKDSVIAIYEDRLVAKDLIFDMSNAIQEKEIALALADTVFFSHRNKQVNKDIEGLILKFEQTKLTRDESNTFLDFKDNFETLKTLETAYVQSNFNQKSIFVHQILKVQENLFDLSKIQLTEGKKQLSISKKAIDSVELFTQIEIYILIFLAIVVQILVIYNPKEKD